jgi:Tol biopolymer transport system component/tRNA A-37 threonylcarbamoyl transferase component Bud32
MSGVPVSDTAARLTAALAGRYRIERPLGVGGMATVYLAEDMRHRRRVAIKVLHAELSAVLGPERFLKEIELTASLQHPHILPLFDSGSADGLLYYVMPFVEGESLRARLDRESPLPIADAVRIATEVADALEYAHERGVIHRDVKPENILLQGGHWLVSDFGIALAVQQAGNERLTQTGLSVGTPQYVAPEQAAGERSITGRADVYALGSVTYEMLVGEPPFTGPNAQAIVAKVLTELPPPLSARRRSISPALEHAVLTALEKLPADRFDTAAAFATALVQGSSATGAATAGRGRTFLNVPASLLWSAVAIGVLGAVALAYMAGSRTTDRGSPVAEFGRSTKVTWEPGLEIQPALSPDGRYVAYVAGTGANIGVYVRQVTGGRATRLVEDSPIAQTNPSWSPDGSRILYLSNGGVFSVASSGGAARPEMPAPSRGPIISAVWGPDGRAIAYAVQDSVYIRNADGQTRALAHITDASLCHWSHRGEFIACAAGNSYYSRVGNFFGNLSPSRVVVARVRDGATVMVTDSTSINQSPAWSGDDRWLYFVSNRLGPRDMYAIRISGDGHATGPPVRLTTGLAARSISVSAADTRFAYDVYTPRSDVWSLPFPPNGTTRAAATPITSGTQVIETQNPSPDGKWIYYSSDVSGAANLYRLRLPDGEPERLTFGQDNDFSPDPSPDGREVAFHSWRSGTRDIYVMPLDGGAIQTVTSSPMQEAQPRWSSDGRALTYSIFPAGGIWVVRRDSAGVWQKPRQRSAFGSWAAWSPDSRWIAFTTSLFGGSLMVVGADTGSPRVVLDSAKTPGAFIGIPLWSPDGRSLYFKSLDPTGAAAIWSIPMTGGRPTLLDRFADPAQPSYRPEWSFGAGRMYFTIDERQSNVWVMDATPARTAK